MVEAAHNTHERHAQACRADEAFQERLAASMKRHRRILDRLARESG